MRLAASLPPVALLATASVTHQNGERMYVIVLTSRLQATEAIGPFSTEAEADAHLRDCVEIEDDYFGEVVKIDDPAKDR